MDIRKIYLNQDMAIAYTAAAISQIADHNRDSIRWNFSLRDIAPIAELISRQHWGLLMGNYGLCFLKGWLWHFEREQMYEWCGEISDLIKIYE